MSGHHARITRRAAIAGFGGLAAATNAAATQPPTTPPHYEREIPVTGKAGPGMEALDKSILEIMNRHGVPGAAFAVARKGKLVLAKGYGWANLHPGEAVRPDDRFGLASLSKPITAVAVLKLVEQAKLKLDDKVFAILDHIHPPPSTRMLAALRDVTVRQCLNHSGGWDRTVSGDATAWEPQISRALRLKPPLSVPQFLSYMLTVPLDFRPGTDAKYSNVGYVILGEVISKVAKQHYATFVAETILKPMGIGSVALHPVEGRYLDREVHRHLAGSLVALPAMRLPLADAAGGWVGSAVDMVRFACNLDGSRGEPVLNAATRALMLAPPQAPLKPREDGTYFGLGWDSVGDEGQEKWWFKDGSYQGMRTFLKRTAGGVAWALLYNASMDFDAQDMTLAQSAVQAVRKAVEAHEKYPDIDLFDEFK